MVVMSQDSSLTISDFKEYLNDETPGMSSKDFFILLKTDNSINEIIPLLELDMIKDLGIDKNNFKRALKN
jgi:hypothetical protein